MLPLLVTVNQSFAHGGGYAVLIGGNIGIMLIEGLIVYIQTIRLHLYEWFPKWYVGEVQNSRKSCLRCFIVILFGKTI